MDCTAHSFMKVYYYTIFYLFYPYKIKLILTIRFQSIVR